MAFAKQSRIKPSGMARTVACPGSIIMQEKCPRMDNSDGKEGVIVHHMGAGLLMGNDIVMRGDIHVTDEMCAAAKYYTDYISSVAPLKELKVEEKLFLQAIHRTECRGIPDATYFNAEDHVLHIFDLKYGFGLVEAYENWQCLTYASGILGVAEQLDNRLDIYIHIIQPRAYHPLGPVRKWQLTLEQLKYYVSIIRDKVEGALSPNPLCFVGPQCKYCTARYACNTLLQSTYHVVDLTEQATPLDLTDVQISNELSLLKKAKLLLDARIIGIEAQVEQGVKRGKLYPGWTLESGRGKTIWNKPNNEIFALGTLLGIDLKQENKPITPNQAKDKGLKPDMLLAFTNRIPGALKLKEVDANYGKQLFGG